MNKLLRLHVTENSESEKHHVRGDHFDAEVHQLALAKDQVHHGEHRGNADEVGDENGLGHGNVCLARSQKQDANHKERVPYSNVHVGGEVHQVGVASVLLCKGHFTHG